MYSCGLLLMDEQRQDDQLESTYSSFVPIRDVALRTCWKQRTIGRGSERGSGISVLIAWHDDDDSSLLFLSFFFRVLRYLFPVFRFHSWPLIFFIHLFTRIYIYIISLGFVKWRSRRNRPTTTAGAFVVDNAAVSVEAKGLISPWCHSVAIPLSVSFFIDSGPCRCLHTHTHAHTHIHTHTEVLLYRGKKQIHSETELIIH